MEILIAVLVFVGFVLALLFCLVALVGGIWLAHTAYMSRRGTKEEATIEGPDAKWKVRLKATGGIFLAIAGLVGFCFVVYHYWQALLGILAIGGVGGRETVRCRNKHKATNEMDHGNSLARRSKGTKRAKQKPTKRKNQRKTPD